MPLELTIRRRGSLLSLVTQEFINEDQANSILALVKSDLTYPEFLRFLAGRVNAPGAHYIDGDGEEWVVGEYGNDTPAGAGDSVEAFRG